MFSLEGFVLDSQFSVFVVYYLLSRFGGFGYGFSVLSMSLRKSNQAKYSPVRPGKHYIEPSHVVAAVAEKVSGFMPTSR